MRRLVCNIIAGILGAALALTAIDVVFSAMYQPEPEYVETKVQEFPAVEIIPLVMQSEVTYEVVTLESVAEQETEIDRDDWERLACVIYQEAGSDTCCDMCRYRVADVVLNRVNDPRYPNTIKEVLEEPRQWGLFSETGIVWPERANLASEAEAVARAYDVAYDVLSDNHSDLTSRYIYCAEFAQGTDWIYCDGIYFGRG